MLDLALLFTATTLLVLIWGFIIGMLRIPYPIVDTLFYCAAGIAITFLVILIHLFRNAKGGRWAVFILQGVGCGVSAYFLAMYFPGAQDFPWLLLFLGSWLGVSIFAEVIFVISLIKPGTVTGSLIPSWLENRQFKKKFYAFVSILFMACGGYTAYYFAGSQTYQVPIQPKDYTIRISFWANWNHSLYTTNQLNDLGNYSTRLYLYNIYPDDQLLPTAPNHAAFLTSMSDFKNHSIDVLFCPGLGINMTTRKQDYARLINASYYYLAWLDLHPEFDPRHGGNMRGVCADIESAIDVVSVNRTEYLQIVSEFETLIDAYHQRGLVYGVATGAYALVDGFDGISDTDLEQQKGLVINGISNMDFIGWESYRASSKYRPSYSVYSDLAQASAFWGTDRGMFWLGITGMANYRCGPEGLNSTSKVIRRSSS